DAGSDYGGYYRDTKFFSSSINLRPMEKWRVETYMRLEDRNLARDTNQVYAPHSVSYQVGVGYSSFVSVYYLNNFQQDKFDNSKYKTREEAIQTRLGYTFSFASIYANMDFGKTKDDLNSIESPYKRFSLSTNINPFARHTYGTSVEYSETFDIYAKENQKRISGNINASIFLGQSTQALLNIFGSRVNASIRQTYSMFEGSIEHILPFKHKIILRGRHIVITPSIKNSENAYSLEYEIPIGLPIKRLTSIGQLRGSVLDEDGKGVANVLINIGDNKTLTDRNGLFSFGALKPGTAYLSVDKASIGFERITDKPMPLELAIKGGEEQTLVLRVARSITIAGEVILFGSKQTGILDTTTVIEELGGRAGVFLEISSSTETHRRVSDSRGKFQFSDIRPGEWVFKVIGGDIPAYHTITPESVNIKLLPGERKDIRIEIKPRRRTIKMLEGNLSVPPQLSPKPEKPVNVAASTAAVTPKSEKPIVVKPSSPVSQKIEKKETAVSTFLPHKPCMITYVEKRKGYILQISSWLTKSKADKVARIMDNIEGLRTYKQSADIPSIGRRYRVYIGDFKTKEEAMEFCYSFDFDF
ncbi:MAG: SPOR domain-containing protein, partial [Bacteroidetes bacterium]|nr:SPOR domain-containing protein [Bacteroidota bacterium]